MQLLLFIGGIALFLFAMQLLEHSVRSLATARLKSTLLQFTRTPLLSVCTGIVATAVLQSSSLLGLILLALLAVKAIPLKNAIGVILGANLGTTITGWFIVIFGFKLGWEYLIILLLLLLFIILVFSKNLTEVRSRAKAFFAFFLLLVALWSMKTGIEFVYQYLDIKTFNQSPIWLFFIIGALLTSVTQSSSATMAIALSAVNADIIELPNAVALIIGADLGTTSTVILGAVRGAKIKRQLAFVHLSFNTIVDLLALLALPTLLFVSTDLLEITDSLIILVSIHTFFNLIGLLIFMPFLSQLESLTVKLFTKKSETNPPF
ncbi:MAG: Na/Pi cotransporter family protein [Gammaproteobacteria bacterium]|nr:Na/Pi cotransporter family protein [Gammaproteobacteria bacterium]